MQQGCALATSRSLRQQRRLCLRQSPLNIPRIGGMARIFAFRSNVA
jgi:hypothetical protein